MRYLALLALAVFAGCSPVEMVKTVWGSSTRALEEERGDALTRTYDHNYWDCMKAVLGGIERQDWLVFKKDEIRGYMVIMHIKGAVDTTEVGIFVVELSDNQTRIEISSLSTNAKRMVAKALFHDVDITFGLAAPDPVPVADEAAPNDAPSLPLGVKDPPAGGVGP